MREENERAEADVLKHILRKAVTKIEQLVENASSANICTFTILKVE